MPTPDLAPISTYWDSSADTFDEEPDHGLRDPHVRAAWWLRLTQWLPSSAADVLDLGCGTGSLTLLLAQQGHRPTGVDLSPRMIDQATRKLEKAGVTAPLMVGDAAAPPVESTYDAVLVRHLVWTLPAPEEALRRWLSLLRPGGRLILVEGRWSTPPTTPGPSNLPSPSPSGLPSPSGPSPSSPQSPSGPSPSGPYAAGSPPLPWHGGVPADQLARALAPVARVVHHEPLTDPALWGRPINDERYVLIAQPT